VTWDEDNASVSCIHKLTNEQFEGEVRNNEVGGFKGR